MQVSFILPAWNEARLVARAVDSISEAVDALGLDAEIIVADDASTDETAEVARRHGAAVVTEHHRQIAATRNAGARHAAGDALVFVDADSAVSTELVRLTIDALEAGCAGGGARCAFDATIPRWARIVARVVLPLYARAGLTPGAYVFATRRAFDAVGGFDESVYGGEEVLFARRVRRQGRFVIVNAPVLTSGRKLRTHSGWALLSTLLRLLARGRRGARTRDGFELWYDERRHDPGCPVGDRAQTK